ncbi:right-handed parallel beta-helix repeat-containing protein [Corallococcus sp. H22C18031201]|nr:right-handed parallel beta-helix repeat-containing protein [Corallococcus sp. H22C18031201]
MNQANTRRLSLFAGALWVLLGGCTLLEEPSFDLEPSGSVRVMVVLPRSLRSDAVARVRATATPADGAAVEGDLSGSGSLWAGSVARVRSGPARVRAEALDASGAALASLDADAVDLPPHHAALLLLLPQAASTKPPVGNVAPVIDAVVAAEAVVKPGATVALRARAHDPNPDDADTLKYAWKASAGVFSDAASAAPTWTAPADAGNVTVTLSVSDAHGAVATLGFAVSVGLAGLGEPSPQAVFNRWPAVTELGARPSAELPVNEAAALEASATDDDGDALTYGWAATCEGTFDDATAATPHFTPTAMPASDTCGNCRLTVTMRDAYGGEATRGLDVCVVQRQPPRITSTAQSSTDAVAGQVLQFDVAAMDPQGRPLTFAWTATTGAMGPATSTATTSTATWTELSCVPSDTLPVIAVTVTNAAGLRVSRTFPVTWGGRLCGAQRPCAVTLGAGTVTLGADCTTEGTVYVPDGHLFDGAGFTLTAVEQDGTPASHWKGAVLRNRGASASIRQVVVTARGLADLCDTGADRLVGIQLQEASGAITDTQVRDLHQKEGRSGCQEGLGIDVRGATSGTQVARVDVLRNQVAGYQKAGIVVSGLVDATLTDNTVTGVGPQGFLAPNGIQLGYGVTGRVNRNTVTGNGYTGGDVAAGILVVGGAYYGPGTPLCKDVTLQGNTLDENDVGINLAQADGTDAHGNVIPPAELTRIQVTENRIHKTDVTNGLVYQAGIADLGSANVISLNDVTGPGYSRATRPDSTFDVDVLSVGTDRKLVFLNPERSVVAKACSPRLVVQAQDAVGNLAPLVSDTVSVSATGTAAAGVTFHLKPDCSDAAVTALPLEGTQREAVFYFQAAQAGDLAVTVAGGAVTATQPQTSAVAPTLSRWVGIPNDAPLW